MRVNRNRLLAALLCGVVGLYGKHVVSVASAASDAPAEQLSNGMQLVAMPSSCVALHRGQLCFQQIRLSWYSTDDQRYCLFSDDADVLLYCSSSENTYFLHEYSSKSSESFSLRLGEDGPVVSAVKVSTSWVYRTGRRSSSGWRLF